MWCITCEGNFVNAGGWIQKLTEFAHETINLNQVFIFKMHRFQMRIEINVELATTKITQNSIKFILETEQ